MQITFWVHQKEKAKREILSKCTSETLHTDDRELPTDFFFSGCYQPIRDGIWLCIIIAVCSYLKIGCYRFLLLLALFACIHVHTHFALKNAPLLRIETWSCTIYISFLANVFLISRNEILIKMQIYDFLQSLIFSSIT